MSARASVLVVDDSAPTLEVLERNLSQRGYAVATARDVPSAVAILEERSFDVVVTDHRMPKVGGMDLVRHVRENVPGTAVMMITGYASVGGAVAAVQAGADEYLAKPFTDEELFAALDRVLARLAARRAAGASAPPLRDAFGLVGESAPMAEVRRRIERAAASRATVLITGESGTGKELVARAVHYASARAAAPFVPVNCAAIPEGLIESELFGHVRGAFTGALDSRAGFFLTAEGGTVFLDEIGELSPAVQAKLLRVLQDQEITMVGSTRSRRVDVRIVAATNQDLAARVGDGRFREDLYYRLNVLSIEVPPLRDRGDDVLLLARHLAEKFAAAAARPAPRFTDAALDALRSYPWPGNVRELENLVQRILVLDDVDPVDVADLPAPMRFAVPREPGGLRPLAEVVAEHVRRVVDACGGNKTRAAEILGIDRKTLREKLRGE